MKINKLVIKTGTQCTLSCAKCGEFNPYLHFRGKAFSLSAGQLISDVLSIMSAVESIGIVHIAGGEPLYHKDLHLLITTICKEDKIENVEIVTNGTITPNQNLISALQEAGEKCKVLISDYTKAYVDNKSIISVLSEQNIHHQLIKEMVWKDKSDISEKGYSTNTIVQICGKCSGFRPDYYSLIDGIVTAHCPTSGSLLYYLDKYKEAIKHWFNVRDCKTANEVLEKMKTLNQQTFTPMCNYCVPSYSAKNCVAGQQLIDIEKFAIKNIASHNNSIYFIGKNNKAEIIKSWIKDNGLTARVYQIEPDVILSELDGGVVVIAENEKKQRDLLRSLGEQNNAKPVVDYYDLEAYPAYKKCLETPPGNLLLKCRVCNVNGRSCPIRRQYYIDLGEPRSKCIRHIAIKAGYICNLKCKYCCEFLPSFSNEQCALFNPSRIVDDIKKLSASLEYIKKLSLSGGDVLLNRGLDIVINEIVKLENIGDIYCLTNGTYIPHTVILDAIQKHHNRIRIVINNYSRNNGAVALRQELERRGISHQLRDNSGWYDVSDHSFRHRTTEELRDIYEKCLFDNNSGRFYHIYCDGKITERCGIVSGKLDYLNKWEECATDWIDLAKLGKNEIPDALTALENKGYCDACNYCPGCTETGLVLQAAGEQL